MDDTNRTISQINASDGEFIERYLRHMGVTAHWIGRVADLCEISVSQVEQVLRWRGVSLNHLGVERFLGLRWDDGDRAILPSGRPAALPGPALWNRLAGSAPDHACETIDDR